MEDLPKVCFLSLGRSRLDFGSPVDFLLNQRGKVYHPERKDSPETVIAG